MGSPWDEGLMVNRIE